jgi:hypothetical protein
MDKSINSQNYQKNQAEKSNKTWTHVTWGKGNFVSLSQINVLIDEKSQYDDAM